MQVVTSILGDGVLDAGHLPLFVVLAAGIRLPRSTFL